MDAVLDGPGDWRWVGWVAFASLEPFGPLRDDLRAGVTAAAAASAWGGRASPADFFPSLKAARPAGDVAAGFLALCPVYTTLG